LDERKKEKGSHEEKMKALKQKERASRDGSDSTTDRQAVEHVLIVLSL